MSGWNTWRRFERLQEQSHQMGLEISDPRHTVSGSDYLSLRPRGDSLPAYSRDAELFVGTLDQAEVWLGGWARALQYVSMIGAADHKRIVRYEQRHREYLADQVRRREQAEIVKVLKRPEHA